MILFWVEPANHTLQVSDFCDLFYKSKSTSLNFEWWCNGELCILSLCNQPLKSGETFLERWWNFIECLKQEVLSYFGQWLISTLKSKWPENGNRQSWINFFLAQNQETTKVHQTFLFTFSASISLWTFITWNILVYFCKVH